jgi:hypothetical protein
MHQDDEEIIKYKNCIKRVSSKNKIEFFGYAEGIFNKINIPSKWGEILKCGLTEKCNNFFVEGKIIKSHYRG